MIDTINIVPIIEINGEKQTEIDSPDLKITNHWNRYKELVNLQIDGGEKITVNAYDLIKAINNSLE